MVIPPDLYLQHGASCADNPVKAFTVGSTPSHNRMKEHFQFFQVNTCTDSSEPVLPLCTQRALKSLHTLKIPCPPFSNLSKGTPTAWWYGSTQIIHDSSRIIKTMIVAAPDGKRGNSYRCQTHPDQCFVIKS